MRKYLIGFLVGAVVATTTTVVAEDIKSFVGREIQGEFDTFVHGKKLAQKAVVIDGISFVPVRAIGDSLGLETTFDETKGISLNNKKKPDKSAERSLKLYDLRNEANELTKQIVDLYAILEPYERISYSEKEGKPSVKAKDDVYFETKNKRDDLIAARDEVDKKIKVLTDEIEVEVKENYEKIRSQLNNNSPSPTPAK